MLVAILKVLIIVKTEINLKGQCDGVVKTMLNLRGEVTLKMQLFQWLRLNQWRYFNIDPLCKIYGYFHIISMV